MKLDNVETLLTKLEPPDRAVSRSHQESPKMFSKLECRLTTVRNNLELLKVLRGQWQRLRNHLQILLAFRAINTTNNRITTGTIMSAPIGETGSLFIAKI